MRRRGGGSEGYGSSASITERQTRRESERYHRATVRGNEEALREVERSREAVCALRFERSHGVQSDLTPVFLTHSFPELFLRGYVEPETRVCDVCDVCDDRIRGPNTQER